MLSQSKSTFHFLGNHFGNFLDRCPTFSNLPVFSIHHDRLFVFLALQPIVVVFSQPGSGLQPPRFRGFLLTHNDEPQSVGLSWTSDQSVARDLYLTTHNTHNRQTSMPPVGFEPTILASDRPKIYALDRAATGTGNRNKYQEYFLTGKSGR